jgi:tetratricopeptide (TPR) repeat protein
MEEQATDPNSADLISRVRRLYSAVLFPGRLTPENTLAIRAAALSVLGDVLASDYLNKWNNAGAPELARAEEAVKEALNIDPGIPLAHYANAFIHRANGRHQDASDAFDRAITHDPDFARAYAQKATEQINLGYPDRARELVERAIHLGPQDSSLGVFYWILGRAQFFAGHYREAIPHLETSIEWRPNLWYNRLYLASAHALAGDGDNAKRVLTAFENHPFFSYRRFTVSIITNEFESANPSNNPFVIEAREKFHQGLVMAGMDEG